MKSPPFPRLLSLSTFEIIFVPVNLYYILQMLLKPQLECWCKCKHVHRSGAFRAFCRRAAPAPHVPLLLKSWLQGLLVHWKVFMLISIYIYMKLHILFQCHHWLCKGHHNHIKSKSSLQVLVTRKLIVGKGI